MAELDYNAVGALTDVRRFEWDDTDELYNLIAQSQYQYNARNQITSIAHNNAAGNSIVSHGYLYNADGNITQYTNSIDGSVLYDYDFLGQLTGADYSNLNISDESYQYDLNGNRELVTNANGDLVVYSTGTNNELTSDGAYTYAYDAEGNRISKTNAAGTERELYEWDYRNRLSSVTKQTFDSVSETWQTVQIVEYAYDYNNVLIRKVLDANGDGTADSKTLFLPENYQTAIQLDDADLSDSTYETVSHRYLWTPGQQDKLLADVTPTETLWTLTDHLGTVRDIIQNTPSGLVVPVHIIYDAYGNVLSCKDTNGTDVSNPVLFGFTGKYFDSDTQLQNNVNRWYDATVGRWLSTDPIGFNGADTNLYRYVENNTISLNDYSGYAIYLIDFTENSYDHFYISKQNLQDAKDKIDRINDYTWNRLRKDGKIMLNGESLPNNITRNQFIKYIEHEMKSTYVHFIPGKCIEASTIKSKIEKANSILTEKWDYFIWGSHGVIGEDGKVITNLESEVINHKNRPGINTECNKCNNPFDPDAPNKTYIELSLLKSYLRKKFVNNQITIFAAVCHTPGLKHKEIKLVFTPANLEIIKENGVITQINLNTMSVKVFPDSGEDIPKSLLVH